MSLPAWLQNNRFSICVLLIACIGALLALCAFAFGSVSCIFGYALFLRLKWAVFFLMLAALWKDRRKALALTACVAYGLFLGSRFLVAPLLSPIPPVGSTPQLGVEADEASIDADQSESVKPPAAANEDS